MDELMDEHCILVGEEAENNKVLFEFLNISCAEQITYITI